MCFVNSQPGHFVSGWGFLPSHDDVGSFALEPDDHTFLLFGSFSHIQSGGFQIGVCLCMTFSILDCAVIGDSGDLWRPPFQVQQQTYVASWFLSHFFWSRDDKDDVYCSLARVVSTCGFGYGCGQKCGYEYMQRIAMYSFDGCRPFTCTQLNGFGSDSELFQIVSKQVCAAQVELAVCWPSSGGTCLDTFLEWLRYASESWSIRSKQTF